MLEILTDFSNFGHPADLYKYMTSEGIARARITVRYCFEEVLEKDMSIAEAKKWKETFISPVAGSIQEAIRWIRIGLS